MATDKPTHTPHEQAAYHALTVAREALGRVLFANTDDPINETEIEEALGLADAWIKAHRAQWSDGTDGQGEPVD